MDLTLHYALCLNVVFPTIALPFSTYKASKPPIRNLATNEIKDNILLPGILAYNKIQAQNKGVFYQCNWTAWLQRVLLLKLSDLFIVPDTISLCPSLTFLFLSAFYSPARCRFSSFQEPSCVQILCVVLPSLCSPPLSPSFCLVFSWAVCWTCCWKELCTIGQEGMKKKKIVPDRRVHKATMHRKPPASKTVMPRETPRDQPAALAPSTDFPPKEEQVGFKTG